MSGYPQTCLSAHCGKALCDGCKFRPALAAYHARRGAAAAFEARQDRIRATEALCAETGMPYWEAARIIAAEAA